MYLALNNTRLTKRIRKIDIAVIVENIGEILISNVDKI